MASNEEGLFREGEGVEMVEGVSEEGGGGEEGCKVVVVAVEGGGEGGRE